MKHFLAALYRRLPIIRELRCINATASSVERSISQLSPSMRLLNMALTIQTLEVLKASDPRYRDSRRLLTCGGQYWSQHYEDGMIAEIFRRIGVGKKTFVEIGIGDGSENNTASLLVQGWRGWWIEGDRHCCESTRKRLKAMPSLADQLTLREAFVSPDNISELFHEIGIPTEVDLFSVDIDQNTFHVWAALADFRPRVVVVEYNAGIPASQSWVVPYEAGKVWDGTQAFGASLKAFELLGRTFGYSLVGCDVSGVNAFFVRDDLVDDKFAAPYTAENHYEPPRYGLVFRWSFPACLLGETKQNYE